MHNNGKRSTRYKIITGEEEAATGKRRNFALVGGVICLVVLVSYFVVAAYPSKLFSEERSQSSDNQAVNAMPVRAVLPNSPLKSSTEQLFASTSKVMQQLFNKIGKKYTAPSLQLFEDTITAYECGQALPASGSFYCADQHQVFIDLSFFRAVNTIDTLSASRTQAYIISHQVGHHIEDLMGVTAKIEAARGEVSEAQFRQLTVKAELLADYYAGVWAHYAFKKRFDNGDAELAISDVTQVNSKLSQNREVSLPDPYHYAELGPRSDNFFRGYTSGDLSGARVFEPGELK